VVRVVPITAGYLSLRKQRCAGGRGLVFLIVSPWAFRSMISAIVLGIIWAAVPHVTHRRSFAAVPAIIADRYDVLVDADFAEETRRALAADPADRSS
jgi:hypothetical protein